MDKMRMESVDMTAQNVEKIGNLFPNCITESKDENGKPKKVINFELLKQMLSDDVIDGDEAYEFTWVGKKAAIVEANKPIRKTLRPCKEESVNWDTTENLYIEGDNLEVLKLLQESYLGKINLIYIDPPYNTGHKDFMYNDRFVDSEDGYRHSKWLNFMEKRLKLARNLLKSDGMLFISIDDNELFQLKLLCDKIFGEKNYINTISVNAKVSAGASGGGEDKKLKKNIEYILIYCKNIDDVKLNTIYKETNLMDYISKMKEGVGYGSKIF